jgi:hypothetical protein
MGWNVHPFVNPQGWTLYIYCLEEWRGIQRISPPGDNFTPKVQSSLPGENFAPLGSRFAPRGEVKNGRLRPVWSAKSMTFPIPMFLLCRKTGLRSWAIAPWRSGTTRVTSRRWKEEPGPPGDTPKGWTMLFNMCWFCLYSKDWAVPWQSWAFLTRNTYSKVISNNNHICFK